MAGRKCDAPAAPAAARGRAAARRLPPADAPHVMDAPTTAVVEFGGDEPESKALTGRRAKAERDRKKKLKAGAFGE